MSVSTNSFNLSIQDAEAILEFYDELNQQKQRLERLEVLKRAGLIVAISAWETYVECRIEESVSDMLSSSPQSKANKFMLSKLVQELKRFNSPNSEKTQRLFSDFLGINIYDFWEWNSFKLIDVRSKLDNLVSKRGDAAHQGRTPNEGQKQPDLIKIEELRKSINFLKSLVLATEKAFEKTN